MPPLTVSFTDNSTGTITNRFWDFGDGSTTNTTSVAVAHTYSSAVTATVALTVSGPLGVTNLTRVNYISVTNQFVITAIRVSGANVLISFSSRAGQFYRVEYTDSLTVPNWKTAADFVAGTGDTVTAVHLGGAGVPFRAYRVRLLSTSELVPAANFSGNPTLGLSPLKVTFTDTSAGYVTNRFWDFGDGTTTNSSAQTVSHIYTSAGTNTVMLTATGPLGSSTRTRTNYVAVVDQLLITAIQTSSSNVLVTFTSRGGQIYRLEYTDSLLPANWKSAVDFIPGTGDLVTAAHLAGASVRFRAYRVRLLTASEITPTANFNASPTFGLTPANVTFVDTSTGYATNRFWDFGDGNSTNTSLAAVSHVYSNPGTNSVTLRLTGPAGVSTLTRTNYIIILNRPLVTSIQFSGPNVVVSFMTALGQSYRLEYTDSLSAPVWNTAVDAIQGTGSIISATHLNGATRPFRFYRIRQLP